MGNHLFVIFAVLDVLFAVNSCLNRSFFTFIVYNSARTRLVGLAAVEPRTTVTGYRAWRLVVQYPHTRSQQKAGR